jgi:Mg2+ and Co2+ transporter CorA
LALLRKYAFKLKPHKLSKDLVVQLLAIHKKLEEVAQEIQQKIKTKHMKNRHYKELADKVAKLSKLHARRIRVAKAMLRATQEPQEPKETKKKGAGPKEP